MATKRKRDDPETEVRENAAHIGKVELELRQKLVGAFKARSGLVTTKWTGIIQNRAPDVVAVEKLADSLRLIGVCRTQSEHHMSGSLRSDHVKGVLDALKMTKEQVKEMNEKSEFVELPGEWMDDQDIKVQLEAGQHRFLALEKVYPDDEKERWWILKLFEQPLGSAALDHLRANDRLFMTPLSDGDRFLHCYNYYELKNQCDRTESGLEQKDM
jgi:hypothetical protein